MENRCTLKLLYLGFLLIGMTPIVLLSCESESAKMSKIQELVDQGKYDEANALAAKSFKKESTAWRDADLLIFKARMAAMREFYKVRVEIVDGWTWTREGDYIYVRGSVKNVSEDPVRYWEVVVDFMDSRKNTLDSAYTNSGQLLLPGAAEKFEIMERDAAEYRYASAHVENVTLAR